MEAQAARVTVSEKTVVEKTNKLTSGRTIESLDELCFARSYEVAQVANSEKLPSLISSLVEGGATGFFGFAGILPNIITSHKD